MALRRSDRNRDIAAGIVGGGVFNSKLIVAGSHLYMVIAAFPSAGVRQDRDVARFFNSFEVTLSSCTPASSN